MKRRKCGSTEHLQRNCPQNQGGSGGGVSPMMFSLEDNYPQGEFFTGLQLDGSGGSGLPETASHPCRKGTSRPWDGTAELPWTSADLNDARPTRNSQAYPVWAWSDQEGSYLDMDMEPDPWSTEDTWVHRPKAEAKAPPPPPPDAPKVPPSRREY